MSNLVPVGYEGQRYEVRCKAMDAGDPEESCVVGWTDDHAGGAGVRMVNLHPIWHSSEVIDLNKRLDKK